jgi:ribose-phosphate pyrophosphokinase
MMHRSGKSWRSYWAKVFTVRRSRFTVRRSGALASKDQQFCLPWANREPLSILANGIFRIRVDIPVAWNMTPFNREVKIFSGSAHPELAKRIAESMGAPLGDAMVTSFPDGESRVKINENIRGRDVFIVQPTCPPTNQNLMELLILIDAARRASAYRITAVIPYFGYARQDRKDQPRVPITAKLVANLLVAAGAHRVLTLDLHAQQIQGFFDIPVDHLYAAPVLIRYIRQKKLDNLVIVSPDVGGLKLASAYAEALGATLAIVGKRRTSPTETEALHVIGDVEGKNVLMVDDLTETAGTLTSAAALLKKQGAREIYAGVSHAVFTDMAHERLRKSTILELITTDSTPVRLDPECRITVLSIAELLGEGIQRIYSNESVSSLFDVQTEQ